MKITIATFHARVIFERLMTEWRAFVKANADEETAVSDYSFGYWLLRYSGWTVTPPDTKIDGAALPREVVDEVMVHLPLITDNDLGRFEGSAELIGRSTLSAIAYLTGIAVGRGLNLRDLVEQCKRARAEEQTRPTVNYDNEGGTGTLDPSDR